MYWQSAVKALKTSRKVSVGSKGNFMEVMF